MAENAAGAAAAAAAPPLQQELAETVKIEDQIYSSSSCKTKILTHNAGIYEAALDELGKSGFNKTNINTSEQLAAIDSLDWSSRTRSKLCAYAILGCCKAIQDAQPRHHLVTRCCFTTPEEGDCLNLVHLRCAIESRDETAKWIWRKNTPVELFCPLHLVSRASDSPGSPWEAQLGCSVPLTVC
jgi:hypothetical protein